MFEALFPPAGYSVLREELDTGEVVFYAMRRLGWADQPKEVYHWLPVDIEGMAGERPLPKRYKKRWQAVRACQKYDRAHQATLRYQMQQHEAAIAAITQEA